MKRLAVAVMGVLFFAILVYADNAASGAGAQISTGGSTSGGTQGSTTAAPYPKVPPKKGKVGKRQVRQLKTR